jgi:hypothetical protein
MTFPDTAYNRQASIGWRLAGQSLGPKKYGNEELTIRQWEGRPAAGETRAIDRRK